MKFPRQVRLLAGADFSRVFKRPHVSRDGAFRMLYRANGGPVSRLGLAVSRKTCKTAVGRHRLKRVVRESFRLRQASLAGAGAVDIVVLPNPAAVHQSNGRLRSSLANHWARIERAVSDRASSSAAHQEKRN